MFNPYNTIYAMKHCGKFAFIVTLSSALAFLMSVTGGTVPAEKKKCMACHDKMYNEAMANPYIHPVFLDKKCVLCHVEGSISFADGKRNVSRARRTKITWLQNQYEAAKTHYFLVPERKVDDTLFVKTTGISGVSRTISIPLPPLGKLPQLVNDGRKPEIFDVQFLGVKHGILYSATISWKTDEPSDGQIHYGVGTFSKRTRLDHQFKTRHVMDILPLTPGKTYTFSVVSKDLHGNRAISQPQTFSTRKSDIITFSEPDMKSREPSSGQELKHRLKAIGSKYFIAISADQPTFMNIGARRELRPQVRMRPETSSQEQQIKHTALKSRYDTTIKTCLGCHQEYQDVSNHPINVRPKRGMTFPKDLPLLADGRMHCMTCHEPHSSRNEARIRRSTKQKLCTGCHKDYG